MGCDNGALFRMCCSAKIRLFEVDVLTSSGIWSHGITTVLHHLDHPIFLSDDDQTDESSVRGTNGREWFEFRDSSFLWLPRGHRNMSTSKPPKTSRLAAIVVVSSPSCICITTLQPPLNQLNQQQQQQQQQDDYLQVPIYGR